MVNLCYASIPNLKPVQWSDVVEDIKLVECVPCGQLVDVEWTGSLIRFLQFLPPNSAFLYESKFGVGQSRELLYRTALREFPDLTHILFLDSDVIPEVPALAQLFSDNKPIEGGACYATTLKGITAWIKNTQVTMQYTQKLIQVDRMGLPFCLIKREVFDKANKTFGKTSVLF